MRYAVYEGDKECGASRFVYRRAVEAASAANACAIAAEWLAREVIAEKSTEQLRDELLKKLCAFPIYDASGNHTRPVVALRSIAGISVAVPEVLVSTHREVSVGYLLELYETEEDRQKGKRLLERKFPVEMRGVDDHEE